MPNQWIEGFLEKCASGSYDTIQSYVGDFSSEGFSVSQLLNQLHEQIIFSSEWSSPQKNLICEKMAVEYCSRLTFSGILYDIFFSRSVIIAWLKVLTSIFSYWI